MSSTQISHDEDDDCDSDNDDKDFAAIIVVILVGGESVGESVKKKIRKLAKEQYFRAKKIGKKCLISSFKALVLP